ncbi:MAG: hypothetical protein OXC38_09885 [Gammaproteobacteria bacterium]|nr:hypothetical protein [Gammaproteobacteria bacterium]
MFDTLAVTKELQESGLASPQAEAIVAAFGTIAGNVATKDDLRNFATKDDLRAIEEKMATKDDLRAIEEKMATKDDLRAIEEKMATKDDLRNFATKDDLRAIESKMVTKDYLKDNLKYYATEASLQKAVGELRQEMNAGFENMQRFFIQAALGTVTVNIAMVTAIFVVAKYLF